MPTKIEKDALTGKETTGHDWDGIRELNTPVPRWWLYVWLATIVWGVALFILYPAIPLGRTVTPGLLGYSSHKALDKSLKALQAERAPFFDKIEATSLSDIQKDPDLLSVALIAGKSAFANNCSPCHGPSGSGRPGYPNLEDDVWLWGGTLDEIKQTITYGVRSGHPDAHVSDMPHFGADNLLTPDDIQAVADYVFTLYGNHPKDAPAPAAASVEAGAKVFGDNCAPCHGDKAQGNPDVGAPRLASATHLYGNDRATIVRQVTLPRQGVMPAWGGRLDDATIKSLALYVHSLGGGQ
ncbi:cytochrome-c oxidase, cbb3-type subunit III [Methyloferula stellata]|uniref:cytochrome-c oxidase, cbb3-type subunit III n=1 Tax=Methyloferula stellata TaxID=876270 RepID=UPI00036FFC8B|nr:cytochrome-c oxidase, cbb3-type subunit III [Methyloferula stellata]